MAKIKLRKFHKIKVHHNRWLIWAIAYVLFVAIAMVGYLKISDFDFDAQNASSGFRPGTHSFYDASLGFGLKYPADWSIEADSAQSINFLPPDTSDSGVNVTLTSPTAEKSIRKSLDISSETVTTLGNQPAVKIINDLGNGHSETVIIASFKHKLYVVRGSDSLVGRLLLTFHF